MTSYCLPTLVGRFPVVYPMPIISPLVHMSQVMACYKLELGSTSCRSLHLAPLTSSGLVQSDEVLLSTEDAWRTAQRLGQPLAADAGGDPGILCWLDTGWKPITW